MHVVDHAFSFSVSTWSAWASGLPDHTAWRQWAQVPTAPGNDETAQISAMPAMLRRRAERLGKAALHALYEQIDSYDGQPIIFCSRYGELQRTLGLLTELADNGTVSPQQFSMAVHNAIAGLFMIAQKRRAPIAELASENALTAAGLIEAAAQLADGAEEVWLLYCDEPLPEAFPSFNPDQPGCHAVLLALRAGDRFTLHNAAQNSAADALDLLRFIINNRPGQLALSTDWQLNRAAQ